MRQQDLKKKEKDQTAEGLAAAGRLVKSEKTSIEQDPVARLQKYGMEEMERNRKKKEEEEKKKKSGQVVQPPKGILQRLYESVMGTSDK